MPKKYLNVEYGVTIKELVSDEHVFDTACVSDKQVVQILKVLGCEDWEIDIRLEEYRTRIAENTEEKDVSNEREVSTEVKVIKVIETKVYGPIFTVHLPVRFFFNRDGSYDGLEVYVKDASDGEQELIRELIEMLVAAGEKKHE